MYFNLVLNITCKITSICASTYIHYLQLSDSMSPIFKVLIQIKHVNARVHLAHIFCIATSFIPTFPSFIKKNAFPHDILTAFLLTFFALLLHSSLHFLHDILTAFLLAMKDKLL